MLPQGLLHQGWWLNQTLHVACSIQAVGCWVIFRFSKWIYFLKCVNSLAFEGDFIELNDLLSPLQFNGNLTEIVQYSSAVKMTMLPQGLRHQGWWLNQTLHVACSIQAVGCWVIFRFSKWIYFLKCVNSLAFEGDFIELNDLLSPLYCEVDNVATRVATPRFNGNLTEIVQYSSAVKMTMLPQGLRHQEIVQYSSAVKMTMLPQGLRHQEIVQYSSAVKMTMLPQGLRHQEIVQYSSAVKMTMLPQGLRHQEIVQYSSAVKMTMLPQGLRHQEIVQYSSAVKMTMLPQGLRHQEIVQYSSAVKMTMLPQGLRHQEIVQYSSAVKMTMLPQGLRHQEIVQYSSAVKMTMLPQGLRHQEIVQYSSAVKMTMLPQGLRHQEIVQYSSAVKMTMLPQGLRHQDLTANFGVMERVVAKPDASRRLFYSGCWLLGHISVF
ncbi:hypothetical protein L1987_80492 [Smallanthus sonchifolius]|uniref:Uncharacterized protein n=1 Tax=Smallanthus sonchifolius TaxID=185202 RepID=A0ACB8YN08_9ASTR|nr:hypothetical protein L1987_80492 [Smallanthus sonchifolius]